MHALYSYNIHSNIHLGFIALCSVDAYKYRIDEKPDT